MLELRAVLVFPPMKILPITAVIRLSIFPFLPLTSAVAQSQGKQPAESRTLPVQTVVEKILGSLLGQLLGDAHASCFSLLRNLHFIGGFSVHRSSP